MSYSEDAYKKHSVGKGRVVGSWSDADWESGDERPKRGRVEGRCMRMSPWRLEYGDKLEELLAALWRVVDISDDDMRERAMHMAVYKLWRMVDKVREARRDGSNMCPSPDPDREYMLFKRQLRQVEKWCYEGRNGENADVGVLRSQLDVLEGWMREVGVVVGPWQRDEGTTCRRSVRLAEGGRVSYKLARDWKRRSGNRSNGGGRIGHMEGSR
jgi:hypothetical protein